jgi:hypothetical protein
MRSFHKLSRSYLQAIVLNAVQGDYLLPGDPILLQRTACPLERLRRQHCIPLSPS